MRRFFSSSTSLEQAKRHAQATIIKQKFQLTIRSLCEALVITSKGYSTTTALKIDLSYTFKNELTAFRIIEILAAEIPDHCPHIVDQPEIQMKLAEIDALIFILNKLETITGLISETAFNVLIQTAEQKYPDFPRYRPSHQTNALFNQVREILTPHRDTELKEVTHILSPR